MATYDDIAFGQRLILTAWEALNENEIEENAYDLKRAFDMLMTQNKNFHKPDSGGSLFEANVAVAKMPITQVVPEGSEYNLQNIEPFRGAKWNHYTITSPLCFTLEQVAENNGRAKLMDTAEKLARQANTDHMDKLDTLMFRGGGVVASDLESLDTIVGTADFGGLSSTTFPTWKGYVDTTTNHFTTFGIIDTAITAATYSGTQGIRYLITGPALFNKAKSLGLASTTVYQPSDSSKPNTGPGGVQVVEYLNTTWIWDRRCQDTGDYLALGDTKNRMYGIDDTSIHFQTLKRYWKNGTQFKDAPFANAYHQLINTMGNFVAESRRNHFKLTDVATS